MMKIDSFSHNPYDSNTGMLDWWDEGIDTGYNTYPSTLTEQLCYSTIPTDEEEPETTGLIVAKYLITDLSQPIPLLSCGFNDEMTQLYHFYDIYDSLEIDGEEVDATQYETLITNPELQLQAYAIVYQFDSEGEHTVKLKIKDDFNKIVNSGFGTVSSLVSIGLPNGITSIGYGSFYESTGLTSITIPNSVTSIGDSAFLRCTSLTSVNLGNGVTSIGSAAFAQCDGLTSITIPNSVTEIGDSAFQGCTGLTSATIPNSVTSIGANVFWGCSELTSATIGNNVTSIGNYAFYNCTSLTSIEIPNSVTSIGEKAFEDCSNLVSITSLATTAPGVESDSFGGVKNNGTLYVPVGSSGYDDWMSESQYYLGFYDWTLVEQ